MKLASVALISAIVGLIGVTVWLTSDLERRPMITNAAHAAIRVNQELMIAVYSDQSARDDDGIEYVSYCVDSQDPLDFDRLRSLLADTIIRPVTVETCDSVRVESNDAMFAYFVHWHDSRGARSALIHIPKISCPSATRCIVDIYVWEGRSKYTVEKVSGEWAAKEQELGRVH